MLDLKNEIQFDLDFFDVMDEPVPDSPLKILRWLEKLESKKLTGSDQKRAITMAINKKLYISLQDIVKKLQKRILTNQGKVIETEYLTDLIDRLNYIEKNWREDKQDQFLL
jgi:hypothetical protein